VQSTALPPLRGQFSGWCSFYQAADTDPAPGVGDMEAQPERARVLVVIGGLRVPRGDGSSGDATAPLALLVHPDSGIFQFARFVIDIHLEHG
jgi:hypothetical protein